MKAIVVLQPRPVEDPECFVEMDLPAPLPGPRDVLVRVRAVSVNPADFKARQNKVRERAGGSDSAPKVLGWDAAGVVEALGSQATLFKKGDEVFYSGNVAGTGCNSELHAVDERIVGPKPRSLSFAQAAAMPLTFITAWECLFDRLEAPRQPAAGKPKRSVLIIGGAGGVGSAAIQLGKRVAGLTVVTSASRPESVAWCRSLGADQVIDHGKPFLGQLQALGTGEVDYILCLNGISGHWAAMAEAIKPQGRICSIFDDGVPLNLGLLKTKSAGFVWESMATRPMFQTPDMIEQQHILARVSKLVEDGVLRTTQTEMLGKLTPRNLALAHGKLESGRTIGKLTLESAWA